MEQELIALSVCAEGRQSTAVSNIDLHARGSHEPSDEKLQEPCRPMRRSDANENSAPSDDKTFQIVTLQCEPGGVLSVIGRPGFLRPPELLINGINIDRPVIIAAVADASALTRNISVKSHAAMLVSVEQTFASRVANETRNAYDVSVRSS